MTPDGNILLHVCCAPCSGAIIESLVKDGVRPVVFFSNSNIVPREEYDLRLSECRRYCEKFGLELVEDAYDHGAWLAAVKGREGEPERGEPSQNPYHSFLVKQHYYMLSDDRQIMVCSRIRIPQIQQVG